ncbi:MAG: chromate transporter, partial [Planctomycetota bacterium]
MSASERPPEEALTLPEAARFWLKLGLLSFGGPAGQIALMHRELVERRRWISDRRFLHALNYCLVLPGPEAQQLATYIGWLLHGIPGGIVAGGLFVLPSLVLLILLSSLYVAFGAQPWAVAALAGAKLAVIAIVAAALFRLGRRALHGWFAWGLALAAFLSL